MSVFVHQLRAEQLVFWRSREAAVFIFIFPIMLFVLLASVFDGDYEGRPVKDFLLTGLLGYGAANTAFAGLAITLVLRREYALLKRIRATPAARAGISASKTRRPRRTRTRDWSAKTTSMETSTAVR